MFVVGVVLGLDAYWSGSLWRYQFVGYCVAAAMSVPLATRLLFGVRVHWLWRRAFYVAAPLLACLLLGEGAYRLFGPAAQLPSKLLPDARLGHRMEPGAMGTDERGYRNQSALTSADVLVVGDSQAWGFAVEVSQAFAAAFAREEGLPTYQMANGSYGPVQYCELLRRGLGLSPKLVVVSVYFGNDLIDAVDYAGLEGAESIRTKGRSYSIRDISELASRRQPNLTMAGVDAVLGASRLLGAAGMVVKSRLRGGVLESQPGAKFFSHPTAATVFLPSYRMVTVDPQNPTVVDGLAVTSRCLGEIAARCAEHGVRCVVLSIPTKEFTYAEWQGVQVPELAELHAAERAVRLQVFAAADAAGIPVIQTCEALVEGMRAGRMPWFATGDGHLSVVGHAIVAELLQHYWRG